MPHVTRVTIRARCRLLALAIAASTVFDNDPFRAALCSYEATQRRADLVTSKTFVPHHQAPAIATEVLEDARSVRPPPQSRHRVYGNDAPKATPTGASLSIRCNEREYAKTPSRRAILARRRPLTRCGQTELLEGRQDRRIEAGGFAGTQTWEYFSRLLPELVGRSSRPMTLNTIGVGC